MHMRFSRFFGILGVVSVVCAAPFTSRIRSDTAFEEDLVARFDSRTFQDRQSPIGSWGAATSTTPTRREDTETGVINVVFDYNHEKEHTDTEYDNLVKEIVKNVPNTANAEVKFINNPNTHGFVGVSFHFSVGKKRYHAAATSSNDVYVEDVLAAGQNKVVQKGKRTGKEDLVEKLIWLLVEFGEFYDSLDFLFTACTILCTAVYMLLWYSYVPQIATKENSEEVDEP
ncbi:hypothetical protein EV368DRAFT_68282 [Lentinula lateritia]|uniref:Uncharacterized protein n=1 Tax=Lentinula aff. lateritia TaxID=2804960 RepID=A0ACC1TMW3_9AGAR|nr:hypothetical protein F5876DRAFT_69562 [Lentinula aff. lateritia]KAJ3848434.1 hypothetical protein EV368DRAFT_68282 [Lentinula lateritia]